MKSITLKRPEESVNRNFSYDIFIGKTKVCELKNGETIVINIAHDMENEKLKAGLYWCGSRELIVRDIAEDEVITIHGNELLNRRIPLLMGLFPLLGLTIASKAGPAMRHISVGILIVLFIFLVGTLTIARNKWLISEVEK